MVLLPSFAVMQASQDQPRHTHRADGIHVETEGTIPSEGTIKLLKLRAQDVDRIAMYRLATVRSNTCYPPTDI